jgi:hypothetical protein
MESEPRSNLSFGFQKRLAEFRSKQEKLQKPKVQQKNYVQRKDYGDHIDEPNITQK